MPYVLYPLILCLIPIHSLYAQNITEVSKNNYISLLSMIEAILALGFFTLNFLFNNLNISAVILCINFFLLLYANYIFIALFSTYKRHKLKYKTGYSLVYIFLCGIISFFIAGLLRKFDFEFTNKFLFYTSLTITCFIILDIFQRQSTSKKAILSQETTIKNTNKINEIPDIYHIILDAHSGFANEELCDSTFKEALEERGFHVYENFMSNYTQTYLSLPSLLNMDYIDNLLGDQNQYYHSTTTYPLYPDNIVWKQLKTIGYECNIYVAKILENIFHNHKLKMESKKDNQLLNLIIFSSILKSAFNFKKDDYSNNFADLLEAYSKDSVKNHPQYRFLHALAPHLPYFFDENGCKLNHNKYFDDNNYNSYMKYVDKNIIQLIDKIKSKMKQNSIIIIHSDHGRHYSDSIWNVLCAIYFPNKEDHTCIPTDGTLVNLFRYLFNKIYSTEYKILDNLFYRNAELNQLEKIENPDISKRSECDE